MTCWSTLPSTSWSRAAMGVSLAVLTVSLRTCWQYLSMDRNAIWSLNAPALNPTNLFVFLCVSLEPDPMAGVQSDRSHLSWGILSKETGSEPKTSSSSWYSLSWTSSEVDRKWSAQIHTVKTQHFRFQLQWLSWKKEPVSAWFHDKLE